MALEIPPKVEQEIANPSAHRCSPLLGHRISVVGVTVAEAVPGIFNRIEGTEPPQAERTIDTNQQADRHLWLHAEG